MSSRAKNKSRFQNLFVFPETTKSKTKHPATVTAVASLKATPQTSQHYGTEGLKGCPQLGHHYGESSKSI